MTIVIDPVCRRELDKEELARPVGSVAAGAPEVDPSKGTRRFHDGAWYYFCSLDCRNKFLSSPETYLQNGAPTS